jgi:hypothetical protein
MVDHCAVCKKTEAESRAGELWTLCSSCALWYHNTCAKIEKPVDEKEFWSCKNCISITEKLEAKKKEVNRLQQREKKRKEIEASQQKTREFQRQIDELKGQEEKFFNDLKSEADEEEQGYSGHNNRYNYQSSSNNDTLALLLERQMKLVNRQYLTKLPSFDGKEEDWPSFVAQFDRTTEEGSFDDADNTSRLRDCLKGDALETVKGALSLPNSAKAVMKILAGKYGDTDRLVKKEMKLFQTLSTQNENKPRTVTKFYEFILNLKATLMSAKAFDYINSPLLLDTIIEKLPNNSQRSWYRHKLKLEIILNVYV